MGSLDRMVSAEDDDIIATVNIIPFVDIVLVLLIIFMLTSAAIARASVKVELPRAASGGEKVDSTLNFVYTEEGELLVNGDETSLEDAASLVRSEADKDPKTQAVISADRGVDYGRVIELIDMVKQNGITTFALDVERIPAPSSP